jgi:hypothetical protein
VEQWTRFGGQWCGGERVRARRSRGGNGGSVSPLERGESERGDRGASEGQTSASGCNTLGVCHSLSSGFELKHDRLSGDDNVKVNLWR